MIASFGQIATTRDYIKPEFTSTLALKAARHPILDQVRVIKVVARLVLTALAGREPFYSQRLLLNASASQRRLEYRGHSNRLLMAPNDDDEDYDDISADPDFEPERLVRKVDRRIIPKTPRKNGGQRYKR